MTDTQERVVINQNTNGLRFEFLRRLENSFITSERFIYGTIAVVVVVVAVFYHKHAINSHEARFETTVEAIQKLEEKMVRELNVLRGLLEPCVTQQLTQDLEEKTIQFHRFVIALRQRYGHSLSRLFNMDETPMRFELPSSRTLEFSGSRTVPVKSCGAEKRSFTVTLAVAADGKKLPPSVDFKGVRTPRDLAVPVDTVRVSFHKKGWMDEKGVKEWIPTCLPRNPRDERSLLVWDSFRAHLTESVKADLQRRKIDVAVIPGGLTPVLQPLDKCLNKPFKDNMRYINH